MSLEFDVKLHRPIALATVAQEAIEVLRQLLNLQARPNLSFVMDKRVLSPSKYSAMELGHPDDFLIVEMPPDGSVFLSAMEITTAELPDRPDEEDLYRAGLWLSAGVWAIRSPESNVLALSLATAVAKITGEKVVDDPIELGLGLYIEPSVVLDTLRITQRHESLKTAASDFWQKACHRP